MDARTERAQLALARSSLLRRHMVRSVEEHRDGRTGEVCATTLAEAAANAFDLYEDADTIPEVLFEVAADVAAKASP
jgi:hypothetical protein